VYCSKAISDEGAMSTVFFQSSLDEFAYCSYVRRLTEAAYENNYGEKITKKRDARRKTGGMRLITAPRFLKMATTAFGAWWLFSRLAGLAGHVTNQLCSRSSNSNCYHGKNNNSHRVSENLTDVEHVMRSFRISGKNILLFLNTKHKTKILKSFSNQAI
jgi:hypothetical protein